MVLEGKADLQLPPQRRRHEAQGHADVLLEEHQRPPIRRRRLPQRARNSTTHAHRGPVRPAHYFEGLRMVSASAVMVMARLATLTSCAQKRSRCRPAHRGRIARGQAHGLARDRAASVFLTAWLKPALLLAGHSPRVDAPPLRGRARRVADAGDGPAGTEKAIRRRCEPPSVADGDGRIHNIGMTFVYHSHIM